MRPLLLLPVGIVGIGPREEIGATPQADGAVADEGAEVEFVEGTTETGKAAGAVAIDAATAADAAAFSAFFEALD